ncbi:hypothetical protein GOBAR_DD34089 [Gossypium barbadense]|nr:hypothetical protein GOBAR_DD34089 [Gossypium barbadense]
MRSGFGNKENDSFIEQDIQGLVEAKDIILRDVGYIQVPWAVLNDFSAHNSRTAKKKFKIVDKDMFYNRRVIHPIVVEVHDTPKLGPKIVQ